MTIDHDYDHLYDSDSFYPLKTQDQTSDETVMVIVISHSQNVFRNSYKPNMLIN